MMDEKYKSGDLDNFEDHFSEALKGDSTDAPVLDEIRESLVRYEGRVQIGQGGMKVIYSCRDVKSARLVAMATLKEKSNLEKCEKFAKEARITASLEHPNIIPVYDVGVNEQNEPFFTMKYIKGLTLKGSYRQDKPSPVSSMQTFVKICDAIAYAHSRNIIHLDLKPDNIQIDEFGEVLVCDWGLAKIVNQAESTEELYLDPVIYNDFTLDGCIKGSPGYLAPEQISAEYGNKDERTDVFALGGILYFMLTGNAPFQSENIQYSLKKTLEGKLTSPSQVTAVNVSLEAVCLKALSTSKEQRYSTVLALKQEIDFWLQGFATSAEDATFRKSLWLLLKRHRGISLLIIFILSLSSFFLIKNYYTEKKAYENLQLYIQEKSDKELISKTAAPLLIGLGELALDDGNFSQAKNYANLAVIRDPENMDAWLLKCKVLFFNQEFEACLEICRLHGEETFVKIYQMSKVYSQLKKADSQLLEADDLIELIRSFPNKFGSRMLFDYACQNAPDLNYLIKVSMFYHQEIANPKVKKWLHEIKVVENKVEMNFADHSGMTSLYGLRYLPISKLNISKTPMSKIDNLLKMPLEELDIRFSNIMDPRPILRKRSLKKIYLSKDQTINGNFSSKLARKIIIK